MFKSIKMVTTRTPRGKNEYDERTFVTTKEFAEMKKKNAFAATEEHSGEDYGVLRTDLCDFINKKIISVLDFKGM